jgi:hypothetical protein
MFSKLNHPSSSPHRTDPITDNKRTQSGYVPRISPTVATSRSESLTLHLSKLKFKYFEIQRSHFTVIVFSGPRNVCLLGTFPKK